jgi:hypothetical protein
LFFTPKSKDTESKGSAGVKVESSLFPDEEVKPNKPAQTPTVDSTEAPVPTNNKKSSIFEDSGSDDDLFPSKKGKGLPKVSLNSEKTKTKSAAKKKSSSLFGDDSDDDSELFKSSASKAKKNPSSNRKEKGAKGGSGDFMKGTEEVDFGSF